MADDRDGETGMMDINETSFKLLDLPPELVILILRSLDWISILQCAATCKFLYSLTQTAEIRYLLELAYDGLLPHPSASETDAHACLAALRSRRAAWKYLQWKGVSTVVVPGPCQAYELVGGVFAKSMHAGPGVVPGSQHFLFSWLPTSQGPVNAPSGGGVSNEGSQFDFARGSNNRSTIVRNDIGIPTRDFAIDPTQDLIVLIEHDDGPTLTSPHAIVQIHLRTLSTNVYHPNTTCPIFRHVTPFRIGFEGNAFIQIVDDVVGLFFWADGPGLLIWSWKDGRVCVYDTEPTLNPAAWDFAFLSPRAYMITYTGAPGSIELFTFSTESQAPSGPVLTDNATGLSSYYARDARVGENNRTPKKVAVLLLPPTQLAVPLINFATHTGPYLANPPQTGAPFYTDTYEHRMHVMTLRYEVDDRIFRYTMYVHNKTFMELIRRTDEEWLGKGRLLWWTDWGRENARMVVCHMDFHWLRYVHGTRVVCPPERVTESRVPGQGVLQRIKVLDFNLRPYLPRPSYLQDEEASPTSTPPVQPAPVSWPVVDGEEASLSPSRENDRNNSTVNGDVVETSLVLEPSQIVCEAVFKEPVETTLPYRMVSRVTRVPQGTHGSWWGFSGFMMDEERLIGLKSTALSEGDMCEIMVYTL